MVRSIIEVKKTELSKLEISKNLFKKISVLFCNQTPEPCLDQNQCLMINDANLILADGNDLKPLKLGVLGPVCLYLKAKAGTR